MPTTMEVRKIESPLLTRRDAANYLRIKEQTLAMWASTRRYGLRLTKIGGRAMYLKNDLDAFILARAVAPVCPE
jgi:hypothetical protein